jgi:methionyl-tRNA formyltransferase
MKKVVFFLMSRKGYESLSHFLQQFGGSNISFVVGAEDANVKQDYYDEIKQLCEINKIIFFDRKAEFKIDTKYIIAISWRWIIKQDEAKLIVMHDSLLPKYRGFAPLVNCLVNGEKKIGVTALFASDEYDKGDIIAQKQAAISYPIKINEAINIVSECYKDLIEEVGKNIISGQPINATKQNEADASYSLWLDDEDYTINWNKDAVEIKRFIDAVGFPYSGASSYIENKKVRVIDAEVIADLMIENRKPGKIIFIENEKPVIVCGSGLLKILSLEDDSTAQEMLPLKRFRIRFINK